MDFTESKIFRLSPISQCDLIFSPITGSPQVFISTLSFSSFPMGASLLGKFGKLKISSSTFLSNILFFSSSSEILILYSFPLLFKSFSSCELLFCDFPITWPINLLNFLLSDWRLDISISISFLLTVNSCIWDILYAFPLRDRFSSTNVGFSLINFWSNPLFFLLLN